MRCGVHLAKDHGVALLPVGGDCGERHRATRHRATGIGDVEFAVTGPLEEHFGSSEKGEYGDGKSIVFDSLEVVGHSIGRYRA